MLQQTVDVLVFLDEAVSFGWTDIFNFGGIVASHQDAHIDELVVVQTRFLQDLLQFQHQAGVRIILIFIKCLYHSRTAVCQSVRVLRNYCVG